MIRRHPIHGFGHSGGHPRHGRRGGGGVSISTNVGTITNVAPDGSGGVTFDLIDAGAASGSYTYTAAEQAAGPKWLYAPTLTESPADTFTINDDGVYITTASGGAVTETNAWLRDASAISGEQADFYTITSPADDGARIQAKAIITNSDGSDNAYILAQAGDVAQTLVDQHISSGVTATHTRTVDLSSYAPGSKICVFSGPALPASSVTVGGAPAELVTYSGGNGGSRISFYEYELIDSGGASVDVTVNYPGDALRPTMLIIAVENGVRSDVESVAVNNAGSANLTITPTSAANTVIGAVIGLDEAFTNMTWSSLTETTDVDVGPHGYSTAAGTDVSTGGLSETITAATSARYGFTLVAYDQEVA